MLGVCFVLACGRLASDQANVLGVLINESMVLVVIISVV